MILVIGVVSAGDASNSNVSLENTVKNQSITKLNHTYMSKSVNSNLTSDLTVTKKTNIELTNNDNVSDESKLMDKTSDVQGITLNSINNQSNNTGKLISRSNTLKSTDNSNTSMAKTNITIKMSSFEAHSYDKIILNATIKSNDENSLNGTPVVFKINDNTVGRTTIVNGIASLDYTIPNIIAKDYTILCKVGESNTTLSNSATSTLTVIKDNVSIKTDSYDVIPNSTILLKSKVTYYNGTSVNNAPVVFKINGITIGKTKSVNGVASLNYSVLLKSGTYSITSIVGETSCSKANTTTSQLIVNGKSTISMSDLIFTKKNSTVTLVSKVNSANNTVVRSGKVAFKINGKTIGVVSLTNGVAKIVYTTSKLSIGVYNVSVVYSGNSYFTSSNTTAKLRVQSTLSQYTYQQVLKKANDTKVFIETYEQLPNYVTFGTDHVSKEDFLYLLCQVYASNSSYYRGYFSEDTSSKSSANGTKIYKNDYVSLAKSIVNCYAVNGRTPNNIKTPSGVSMNFDDAFYFYTRAVAYIYNNGICSDYGILISSNYSAVPNDSSSNNNKSKNITNDGKSSISISNLIFAKENSTVTLVSKVTDSNNNIATSGKVTFKINEKTIKLVSLTNGVAKVVYNTSQLSVGIYNISVIYSGNTNLNSSKATAKLRVQSTLSQYTYQQVLKKANDTKVFIETYGQLPNYVTFGTDHVSKEDFLYLLCQVYATNSSYYRGYFSEHTSSKSSAEGTKIYKSDYVSLAKSIVNCYATNGKAPNTIKTASNVTMSFNDTFYFYTRAVAYIYNNGFCSDYGTLIKMESFSANNTVPSGYEGYLVSSSNCQVNNSVIISAVKKATSGITGTYNQAVAIFNYVNDHTSYLYYSNTRYGAVSTLQRGYGNCVDMSHALIAMFRTANIPARYCHATCYFRSGLVVGHVWTEVYVNGKWYKCDATSSSNTFGNIVNWNSCTTVKRYISLPF